jgi:hypothetical protein
MQFPGLNAKVNRARYFGAAPRRLRPCRRHSDVKRSPFSTKRRESPA